MTQTQAFTQALILSIIAPDDEKSEKAKNLAIDLSQGLTEIEVEQCKTDALNSIERAGF